VSRYRAEDIVISAQKTIYHLVKRNYFATHGRYDNRFPKSFETQAGEERNTLGRLNNFVIPVIICYHNNN
jgi:hypothetical protein